jgi:predicted TIM-barrel fold metal-dependent hydrolase
MARIGVISVDGHVKATRQGYRDYIDPSLRDEYDAQVKALEDAGMPDTGNCDPEWGVEVQWDSAARLAALEAKGVVAEVLFPNGVPFQLNPFEDHARAGRSELGSAGRRAYNRWLSDFCAEAPGRRFGAALVSFDDVDQGVNDIAWARQHGLGGVMLPCPAPRMFFDPVLDPMWAACQELDMTLCQHGGIGGDSYTPIGFAAIMTIAVESGFFSNRSLWQMVFGGVFDRFPDLRATFIETQLAFIPQVVQTVDRRLANTDDWMRFASHLGRDRSFKKLMSEYMHSNVYYGVSPFSPVQLPLDEMLGTTDDGEFHLGVDHVMYGVDFPHFESNYATTQDEIANLVAHAGVTRDDVQKILFDNALAVFRLDASTLAPHVERVGLDLYADVPGSGG